MGSAASSSPPQGDPRAPADPGGPAVDMPGTAEELADLAELRGLAMAAARRCAAAQSSAETPEQIAVLTLALDRAARAVRHIIVLEQQCRGARPLPHARGASASAGSAADPAGQTGAAPSRLYGGPPPGWQDPDGDDDYIERLDQLFERVGRAHHGEQAAEAAARGEAVPAHFTVPSMDGTWRTFSATDAPATAPAPAAAAAPALATGFATGPPRVAPNWRA
ncbi:hypothetical protein [Zavarzinia sp. CC-PAN008]|uniref:hypothetical protein n=1 Tax=Zavarzinia sp. CC-PAN008 TaxID=3243332 RepID=UPI003F743A44